MGVQEIGIIEKKKKRRRGDPRKDDVLRNLVRALLQCVVLYPTAIAEEEQSTRVGPTDNFEQSKEKN